MAVRKSAAPRKNKTPEAAPADPGAHDSETSRNIWFAGLGALAKAQAEGSKAFEALVQEGVAAQRAAHDAAQQRMEAFAQRMEAMNQNVAASASRWPGLESIFEARVSRALVTLGLPSGDAWQQLLTRVAHLEQLTAHLEDSGGQAARRAATPASKGTRKPRNPST